MFFSVCVDGAFKVNTSLQNETAFCVCDPGGECKKWVSAEVPYCVLREDINQLIKEYWVREFLH